MSARNPGQNLSQIGRGTLNAGEMLSPATQAQVMASFKARAFQYISEDRVESPILRLLFGLPAPGRGVDEMYHTEAGQIFHRSTNPELADALIAGSSGQQLSDFDRKRLQDQFLSEPDMSETLRNYLGSQVLAVP